ncbi:hypothetical protein DFH94DRAFT_179884 [Russula ochroleuca]|jgi:hypothetical protein|uniref:Uncharacterized protein n=1 Tax=Russula ochroleuca TaxID=152965 RepID=A0A9P5N4V2_9AGAM|nr:hypothetical protein DFH94DRAFT_179884 [Russula ochroleuca]
MPELPCTCAYSTVDRTPPAHDLGGDEDDKPVCKAFRRRSELASVKAIACTIWVELSGKGAGSRALCWTVDQGASGQSLADSDTEPQTGARTTTVHLLFLSGYSIVVLQGRSESAHYGANARKIWAKRRRVLCKWRWKSIGIKFVRRPSYSSGVLSTVSFGYC